MPKRVQRKPGVKLPKGCIYCGRPTKWGNKFKVGSWTAMSFTFFHKIIDDAEACRLFKKYQLPEYTEKDRQALKGKDLACWCKLTEENCHVEILLEWANG